MTLKRFGVLETVHGQLVRSGCTLISFKRKVNGNERVDFTSQMFNSIIPDHDEFNESVSKERFSAPLIGQSWINSAIYPFSIENSSKGVTKNEILSNSLITIVAGYDNVASSVQVILFRLATNPKVQARLFQDISALDEIRDNWTLLYLPDTIFITLEMTGMVTCPLNPEKL